jgi:thiamine biosynthesis lipoprotein
MFDQNALTGKKHVSFQIYFSLFKIIPDKLFSLHFKISNHPYYMKFKHLISAFLVVITASAFISPKKALRTFVSNYENVLGTSLELKFKANNQADADLAEENALKEIDRLDAILSAYKTTSEFNIWMNNGKQTTKVSSELFEVLQQFEDYKGLTNGALDASAAVIGNVWKKAVIENRLPSTQALQTAVNLVKQKHYVLDAKNKTVTRLDEVPLALNSFAKSYIINKAAEKAMQTPGIENVVVNIGGDMVIKGNQPETIEIANPKADAENDMALTAIKVADRAVATSGNYRRGFNVNGKWYSHIVDPRTGNPVSDIISATVIAADASKAGALATSFNVLSVSEIEKLTANRNDIAYLLVTKEGKEIKSSEWAKYEVALNKPVNVLTKVSKADKAWNTKYELVVNLEIANIESTDGKRVRRPFVAVWIEDAAKTPVRNLAIWYNKPRWLPDLKSWNRANGDEFRKAEAGKLSSTSSATRGPGKYSLSWDGKDDSGQLVKAGVYTVFIEVAREHGSYQVISKEMKFTGSAQKVELTPNTELASASLDYRKIPKK